MLSPLGPPKGTGNSPLDPHGGTGMPPAQAGPDAPSPLKAPRGSYLLTRWVFLRFLGLIYLVAFVSLGAQITGLVGENGILPVSHFLGDVEKNLGKAGYRYFPTLAWLSSSD